jgi:hypothetical protein
MMITFEAPMPERMSLDMARLKTWTGIHVKGLGESEDVTDVTEYSRERTAMEYLKLLMHEPSPRHPAPFKHEVVMN